MTPNPLADAVRAVAAVPRDGYGAIGDAALTALVRLAAEGRRLFEAHEALLAAEVDRRFRDGRLGRETGARTPEQFLTATAGVTGRDAAKNLRVGRLSRDPGPLAAVGSGVAAGSLSVDAAESIRAGLSGAGAPAELVAVAAERLCAEARDLDPDRLLARAREVRDELDEAGVTDREALLRSRRSLRRITLGDGMRRILWDYDPLSAGVIDDVYDRATSPRRGGPRFVDPDEARRASEIERDERTTEQIASDAFTELLRQAASVDDSVLLGSGAPAVRVLVSAGDLEAGTGHGVIEGSQEAVSIGTVRAVACAQGTRAVLVDSVGDILDLGREQRLYSGTQRVALAVRDGGCLWPGCDRPPSWTEAHHIRHWARDGRTDLADGVLLCRHHHLRLHNEAWQITRRDGRYRLDAPPGSGKPSVPLEPRSRAMREHLARRDRAG